MIPCGLPMVKNYSQPRYDLVGEIVPQVNKVRPVQVGSHFADDILTYNFFHENGFQFLKS